MLRDKPDAFFGDGLLVLRGEQKRSVAEEAVAGFCWCCFCIANTPKQNAFAVIAWNGNNQA